MPTQSTLKVPLLDLRAQYDTIRSEVDAAVRGVMESCHFIGGPEVTALEQEVARYSQTAHAVACASGTDAILLALWALGVGPGDEVICPSYTFFATAGTVSNNGATPVFVDVDPRTYNLDVHLLERAITPRTKAVVAVSLFGQCADLPAIKAICDKHQIYLIEDAAQSIGSEWEGRRSGSMCDFGTFSFFPSKNLGGAGDGGMIVTQNADLAEKVRLLCNHGAKPKYYHSVVGTNSRLDALQAAILRVKLRHLDRWSEQRAKNAALYHQLFEGSRVGRPYHDPRTRHIYNQYVIRVPRRDELKKHLAERNIGCEVYYPVPLHLQKCFAHLGHKPGDMPVSEAAALETLALPIYPELTEEMIRTVAQTVRDFVENG
ncbi:MAG TPA: DegT/DnrJ/EryC1/StrS family aminotransferase [Candidatus Acidoferrales bacterium]|nr:DegT/DnrJ/EryC1/StrS family aminotransferase [Candidatus Acidoferrales bacterium]